MHKRDYIAHLEGQLANERDRADGHFLDVVRLTSERDGLLRRLQCIRIAHEPLHEAVFPPTIESRA